MRAKCLEQVELAHHLHRERATIPEFRAIVARYAPIVRTERALERRSLIEAEAQARLYVQHRERLALPFVAVFDLDVRRDVPRRADSGEESGRPRVHPLEGEPTAAQRRAAFRNVERGTDELRGSFEVPPTHFRLERERALVIGAPRASVEQVGIGFRV